MADRVLLLVEGQKTEYNFLERLLSFYCKGTTTKVIPIGINIYSFYKKIRSLGEDFTTTLDTLKEIKKNNIKDLEQIEKGFAFIYLVFDFDIQENSLKTEGKFAVLREMMKTFSNEAGDFGRLLIDYPMVEAYRDFKIDCPNGFLSDEINVPIDKLVSYKNIVDERGNDLDINKYKSKSFDLITKLNIIKAFQIVKEDSAYTSFIKSDFFLKILDSEIKNYQRKNGYIVPLCEMTFFLVFLYGKPTFDCIMNTKI
ncbi:MAG: hypothetical protein WCR67_07520 [Bacilli bacterium]